MVWFFLKQILSVTLALKNQLFKPFNFEPDLSQDNINHFIHEYDTTHSAISFSAKIYKPSSNGQRPQFQREIFTKIKEKKEAEKEFKKERFNKK